MIRYPIKIKFREVLAYTPVFAIIMLGRGLDIYLATVLLCTIMIGLLYSKNVIRELFLKKKSFQFLLLFCGYLFLSFLYQFFYGKLNLINFLEDSVSIFLLLYFYSVGKVMGGRGGPSYQVYTISIIAIVINAIILIYQGSFGAVFFNRLWNPYIIFFALSLSIPSRLIRFIIGCIFFSLIFQIFSLQSQIVIMFVSLQLIFISPSATIYKFFVVFASALVFFLPIFILYAVEPVVAAGFDNNIAVRLTFWREAVAYMIDSPFGLAVGQTPVSGVLDFGNLKFKGVGLDGSHDIGVHSGFFSLFYLFGGLGLIACVYIFLRFVIIETPRRERFAYCSILLISLFSFLVNDAVISPTFSCGFGFSIGLLMGLRISEKQKFFVNNEQNIKRVAWVDRKSI